MVCRPFIDLRELDIVGNVLDIGLESCGIMYNIYKLNIKNSNFDVEYSEGKDGVVEIEKDYYNFCVCFFSLRYLMMLKEKNNMIDLISKSLDAEGIVYIWDMNKGYGKYFNGIIRVMLPNRTIKKIRIMDLNIFNDTSMESVTRMLSDKFNILDTKVWDGIYFIKAKKKLAIEESVIQTEGR
jgi:hypothetical protein